MEFTIPPRGGTFCWLLVEPEAAERLKEGARGARAVVLSDLDLLLDGDIVRRNLSSELGFSRAHRDLNVCRIGFVASEITKNGVVALCAPIAPYTATRRVVRECIAGHGAFIEIHVATPPGVCERRGRKGLYEKARKGLIPEFTGISDPYKVHEHPEIRLDTTEPGRGRPGDLSLPAAGRVSGRTRNGGEGFSLQAKV